MKIKLKFKIENWYLFPWGVGIISLILFIYGIFKITMDFWGLFKEGMFLLILILCFYYGYKDYKNRKNREEIYDVESYEVVEGGKNERRI